MAIRKSGKQRGKKLMYKMKIIGTQEKNKTEKEEENQKERLRINNEIKQQV